MNRFNQFACLALAVLLGLGLLACDKSTKPVVELLTLAECQTNGWVHNADSLGACDSLLFLDFLNDCQWSDSNYASDVNTDLGAYGLVHINWRGGTITSISELSMWHLSKISPKIKNIYWMEDLDITNSSIQSLPEEIYEMPLNKLTLRGLDSLHTLPKRDSNQICLFDTLVVLGGALDTLDNATALCPNLTVLSISKTNIRHFPESYAAGYDKLKVLYLRENKLEDLPNTLPEMDSLTYFDVSQNAISILPSNIGEIPNLQTFAFETNLVSEVPVGFCVGSLSFAFYEKGNRICNPSDSLITCLGWDQVKWTDSTYGQVCN